MKRPTEACRSRHDNSGCFRRFRHVAAFGNRLNERRQKRRFGALRANAHHAIALQCVDADNGLFARWDDADTLAIIKMRLPVTTPATASELAFAAQILLVLRHGNRRIFGAGILLRFFHRRSL